MLQNVVMGEHHRWGPRPVFGGGFSDSRAEATAAADLPRYEAELNRLAELRAAGEDVEEESAYVGRLLDWTLQRLDRLDFERGEARRKALHDAEIAATRARLGLPPLPSEQTLEGQREQAHRAEQDHIAAELKAHPVIDPFSKEGKAAAKAELDRLDPFKPGNQPIDARDVLMGRVDAPRRR